MQAAGGAHIETTRPGDFASQIEPFSAGKVSIAPLRSAGFRARADAWSLPAFHLFQVEMQQGRVYVPPRSEIVSLTIALDQGFEVVGGERKASYGPGLCFARDDRAPLELEVKKSSVFVANADARLLRATSARLAGGEDREAFAIDPQLSLTTPAGSRFWRSLMSVWRDLRVGEPWIERPEAAASAGAELAALLIEAAEPAASDDAPACGPASLRRAEDFILAHLGDPISRADICAAAGVSQRSLTRAFGSRHGVGPATFLKRCRLDAAQRLLLAAEPREQSVSEIALRCGLYHFGRFSVEYRRAFGESPSETLRR